MVIRCIMLDPSMMPQGPSLMIRPVKFIENEIESGNESGGTCEGGANRPPVQVASPLVFAFDFVFD